MHYVTSDIHGYQHEAFMALLEKAHFSPKDELYVLGDVIDRNGDGGVETLRWMMAQPNVIMLMGNHEEMLLKCAFLFDGDALPELESMRPEEASDYLQWVSNGAAPTIKSLLDLRRTQPGMLADLLDTLHNLPLYDILKVNGKVYILTHAGIGHYASDLEMRDYNANDLLWHRPLLEESYYPNATVVFGHTPTRYLDETHANSMIRTPTWYCIDTGAAGGGSPMLLRLEDEAEFYAD